MPFPTRKSSHPAFATLTLISLLASVQADTTPQQLEFFETRVRPIFADRCYRCHSAASGKSEGSLRLDTRDAVLKGGDTGPALVPGDPEKSLLLRAVRQVDPKLKMPHDGEPLNTDAIAALEQWIRMGAPDPRTAPVAAASPYDSQSLMARAKAHWAYQPIKDPPLPALHAAGWARNPIDAFILARLEATGLKPNARADARTLIRRVTFDLTGLPPTAEEVDAFTRDPSYDAYEKLVDRLLASPAYGERWGRHWLDVARYADTQGAIFNGEDAYPNAWTYRDWVIRSFNDDLPYDQFLMQQLAADLLGAHEGDAALAGMGFITVGRRPDHDINDDVLDDRIDVVSRGLLGLTAGCARCHDHKLEAITQRDYYGLYGMFKTSIEPKDYPALPCDDTPEHLAYQAERDRLRTERPQFVSRLVQQRKVELRARVGDYLLAAHDGAAMNDADLATLAKQRGLQVFTVRAWRDGLSHGFGERTKAIFRPWTALAALPADHFAEQAAPLVATFAANRDPAAHLNPRVASIFAPNDKPSDLRAVADRYTRLFEDIELTWRQFADIDEYGISRVVAATQPAGLPLPDDEELRKALYGADAPPDVEERFVLIHQNGLLTDAEDQAVQRLDKAIVDIEQHPGAPPRAMAMRDDVKRFDAHVFLRGKADNLGPASPPHYFEVFTGHDAPPFSQTTSGRLELAKAIASKDNPLTARVFVNRVWAWHFGGGLVRTPSDFGFRGEPPTHPELLDWLASHFMNPGPTAGGQPAIGWSIKALQRLICQSATYQESGEFSAEAFKVDQEDRLLWRAPGRPLEFEAVHDALLAVSGRLDRSMGGRPISVIDPAAPPRRAVYGLIDRKTLPNLFRNFDFPNPNYSAPSRSHTALTPQELYLLNSPFLLQSAKSLLARAQQPPAAPATQSATQPAAPPSDVIAALYRLTYQRAPSADEAKAAAEFLGSFPQDATPAKDKQPSISAWEALAQVLLMSDEFAFVE